MIIPFADSILNNQHRFAARSTDSGSVWRTCALNDLTSPWNGSSLDAMRRRLRRWYRREARDLPWRRDPSPYRVWVSEIMLQQTQVATVLPYFERFIAELPSIEALAQADEQAVFRLWEGLGYYRRARHLHRAARQIVDQFAGRFPLNMDDAMRLPGIGRYTAGAILSIADGQALPILEGNTVRLFCRLLDFDGDIRRGPDRETLWRFAEAMVTRHQPGELNQAMMELGSLLCQPRTPKCEQCPLVPHCRSFRTGRQLDVPRVIRRPEIEAIREVAVAIRHHQRWLVRRCGPGDRWAGLWDFPRLAAAARAPASELAARLDRSTGLRVELGEPFATLRHTVTRYRITLVARHARLRPGSPGKANQPWKWVTLRELAGLPLSVTGRKIEALIAVSGRRPLPPERDFTP